MTNFQQQYRQKKAFVDGIVERKISQLICPSPVLLSAIKYTASTGGKRLRAIIAHEFFQFFGKDGGKPNEALESLLAAIEILHLYTLVHDDLPCMDDDDFRRGKPSCHKVYGESMALLCGDALLNLAYETLFEGAKQASDKTKYLEACATFSHFVGAGGVVGGQALEFEQDSPKNKEKALIIYRHKTCDLIITAALAGAIFAGASKAQCDEVQKFGYHFGIAFQIRDDLLDITEKGAPEKNSLVGLIGQQNANNILEQMKLEALASLERLETTSGFLHELTEFAAKRTS